MLKFVSIATVTYVSEESIAYVYDDTVTKGGVPKFDVLPFVDSKNIFAYWKKRPIALSAPQAAYIVWRSGKKSLQEKFEAWQKIVETYPDEEEYTLRFSNRVAPFSQFLKEYIVREKRLLASFYEQTEGYYYSYFACLENGRRRLDGKFAYSSYEECIRNIKKEFETGAPERVYVEKIKINGGGGGAAVVLNGELKVTKINEYGGGVEETTAVDGACEVCRNEVKELFEQMWFVFPVPFQKGDILTNGRGGFVFECLNCQSPTWKKRFEKNCDDSDMTARGYVVNEDGTVRYDLLYHYMDLEDYRPQGENEEILLAIANYLKGNMDLAELMNAYLVCSCQNKARALRYLLGEKKEE